MCGICGVVQVAGDPRDVLEPWRLDAMTDAMTHRGPDDRGTYLAPGVALGARRLSIVDVEGGHQPVFSEDGRICGMQNGELYNHIAIRHELASQGHSFGSRCDTEILPHLYERDGDRYAEHLRGKFATVVWDGKRRRAVLARDRLGVKPLYWARCGDIVVFGSEIKSVLASGLVDRELNLDAIDAYLTLGYVPFPHTPFAAISKLPPGGLLTIGGGRVEVGSYWEYPLPEPEAPGRSLEEYADELEPLLAEAVRIRLMSDVPLGAMLSGGLDSSLVVALMAEASTQPVQTFAIGFREDGDQNELQHAERVAQLFGCDHHEIELSFEDDAADLEDVIWHLDEPVAELSAVGFHALSRLAASNVTVALSGQGADELFGGYRKHLAARMIDLSHLPPAARRPLGAVPARNDLRRLLQASAARTPTDRLLAMSSSVDSAALNRLRGPRLRALDGLAARRAVDRIAERLPPGASALGSTLYLDGQLALVDNMLHYFDRMSMAVSLEVRVPFLDHVVVEWAATLPDSAKVGLREQKRALRQLGRRRLPADIVDRPKVAFFRRSAAAWLERRLAGPLADRVAESAHLADLLDRNEIRALVARFRSGDSSYAQILLAVVMLDLWLDRFTVAGRDDRPLAAAPRR
jgi:asparagine synthase (glutamine-hydrolysing)